MSKRRKKKKLMHDPGRLKSIRNIEKITKTMKIVASTKLTRAQRAMTDSRTYGQTSNQVFEEAETKPLEDKKTLLVVCSSDKGLCGGIHSGLSRATRKILEEDPNMDVAIVGEKCKAQLSRSNAKQIVLSFSGIGKDVPTFADAQAIADQICLLPEEYASVRVLYNKFINAQSYEPTPIEAYSEEAIAQSPNFAAFEIDEEVLTNLREYTLANSLYWALAEGHACEQSARRNAMDVRTPVPRSQMDTTLTMPQNASKNAGDMISKFTILYNRTRQAVITGELVEIITVSDRPITCLNHADHCHRVPLLQRTCKYNTLYTTLNSAKLLVCTACCSVTQGRPADGDVSSHFQSCLSYFVKLLPSVTRFYPALIACLRYLPFSYMQIHRHLLPPPH